MFNLLLAILSAYVIASLLDHADSWWFILAYWIVNFINNLKEAASKCRLKF